MYQHGSRMYGTQWETHMGFSPSTEAAKNLVSFQAQHEHDEQQHQIEQVPAAAWCFEFPKKTTDSLYSVAESFLSSTAESHSSSEEYYCQYYPSYSENYSDFQPGNMSFYDHLIPQEHDKLLRRSDAAIDERKPLEISFQRNQKEKQASQLCGIACVTSSNSASRRAVAGKSKRRIRWTKDLHEPFMMIVNGLGGPEKAKPKAILDMMKSDLLSISHVKSHLQKCRSTMHMHKTLQERSEEGQRTDGVTELQVKISLMQIEESKELQLEIRRSISQQLEMQRNLKMQIEQQSKQLRVMLDIRQKEKNQTEENPLETEMEVTDPK